MGRLVTYQKVILMIISILGHFIVAQIPNDRISINTSQVFPRETPTILTNTDLLLTGERLHYKVCILLESGKASSLSKISYVSLRTEQDSVIFDHKLKLQKGSAYGSFFIPTTLKTGKYRLLSYTNFSLNNLENAIAQRMLNIINPFVKPQTTPQKDSTRTTEVLSSRDVAISLTDQFGANGLSIITDKTFYNKREKISIEIENPNEKFGFGNYVLSVRKVDPVEIRNPSLLKNSVEIEKESIFYIPELRGELISGKVVTADSNMPVGNKVVALSIPGENYIFRSAKTNADGRFFIAIDEPYETTNSIIQINETNRKLYNVVLDKKGSNFQEKVGFPVLKLDSNLREWLEERSVQLQIENTYFKQDSITSVQDYVQPFYGNLGTEFVLDDYTRFPSMEETFVEVITLARIRKKDGRNSFEVFDPFNPYKTGPFSSLAPLLILDGIFVDNPDDIFAYSANELNSIKVFPNAYRYGPKVYRGIIDFKTKGESYKPRLDGPYIKEFKLVMPFTDNEYATPDHSNELYKRLPDYRTQLYWKPNILLASKKLSMSFYASDVIGKYKVTLEGFTNNGEYVSIQKWIMVK